VAVAVAVAIYLTPVAAAVVELPIPLMLRETFTARVAIVAEKGTVLAAPLMAAAARAPLAMVMMQLPPAGAMAVLCAPLPSPALQ
jgi:hypothetical protein